MKNTIKRIMLTLALVLTVLTLAGTTTDAATKYKVNGKGYQISEKAGKYTNYVEIKLSAKKGYTVFYTTNGKTPTYKSKSIKPEKTVNLKLNKNTKLVVKAVKKTKNIKKSNVSKAKKYTYNYTITKKATHSISKGSKGKTTKVAKGTKITLKAANGYTLYYTTNGSNPTTKSAKIKSGKSTKITITKATTIKVVAQKYGTLVKSGKNTLVTTYEYKVKANNTPKDGDTKIDYPEDMKDTSGFTTKLVDGGEYFSLFFNPPCGPVANGYWVAIGIYKDGETVGTPKLELKDGEIDSDKEVTGEIDIENGDDYTIVYAVYKLKYNLEYWEGFNYWAEKSIASIDPTPAETYTYKITVYGLDGKTWLDGTEENYDVANNYANAHTFCMVTYKGQEYVYYAAVNGGYLFWNPWCDVVLTNNANTGTLGDFVYKLSPGEVVDMEKKETELGRNDLYKRIVTPNDCY